MAVRQRRRDSALESTNKGLCLARSPRIALATAKFRRHQRNPFLRAARPPLRIDLERHDYRPGERIHRMMAHVGQPIGEIRYGYRLNSGGRKVGQNPQPVDLPDCLPQFGKKGSQLARPEPAQKRPGPDGDQWLCSRVHGSAVSHILIEGFVTFLVRRPR